jgi:cytochrome b6-f complex iron-sulfur subunit
MPETKELGLFVPPEKAIELGELEQLEREQKQKVSRRMWFRWVGWGSILLLLGQWSLGFVFGFFVPKRLGAFGGNVTAGLVSDYKVGDVKVFEEGKFYITRVPEGLFALYWKCPHLGCTVPWKDTEPAMGGPPDDGDLPFASAGRFHCPCHGSIYNRYGQIIQGPAPRPMDLFPISVDSTGKITVKTGPSVAVSRSVATDAQAYPAPS